MENYVTAQLAALCKAVLLGWLSGCVYDLLRSVRLLRRRSRALTHTLDALYGAALLLALLDEFTRQRGGERVTHSDFLLLSAITLHNIPEGMAVGLAFALAADGEGLAGAAALALGIGVQNFPEGAAVALPVYQSGKSKRRAFWTGVLSGAVEPLFGALVVLAAAGIHALMPWLLSFAAGAMLYVVAEELLPRAGGRRGTCGFLVGFLLMMILDVALG